MSLELRQNLAEEIRAAFKDTVYPGDDQIGKWEVGSFVGKKWNDIPLNLIKYHRNDMILFSPSGFCYFLPAFLQAAVLHANELGSLPYDIIDVLTAEEFLLPDASLDDWHKGWIDQVAACLSKPQKEAVYKYFVAYRELEPDDSWSNFEPDRLKLDCGIKYWKRATEEAD